MKINNRSDTPTFPFDAPQYRAQENLLTDNQLKAQIQCFRLYAQRYELPLSNPYHFFSSFIRKYRNGTFPSQATPGMLLGLLLDYHYLGNSVFPSAHPLNRPDFYDAYKTFPRLIQLNEYHTRFNVLEKSLRAVTLKSVKQILLHRFPVMDTFNIYAARFTHKSSSPQGKKLLCSRKLLELGLALEAIAFSYSQAPEKLGEHVKQFQQVLDGLPKDCLDMLPADFRNFILSGEELSKRKALLIHDLLQLSENGTTVSLEKLKQLQAYFADLLKLRFKLPPYWFFHQAFLMLEKYPDLKTLMPVYFWTLFHDHSKSIDAKRVQDKIFDPLQMFRDPQMGLLSEEATSQSIQNVDFEAFDNLCNVWSRYLKKSSPTDTANSLHSEDADLFFQNKFDKPLCEYMFQRLIYTQLLASTSTSIVGETCKKAVPLFYGTALIYDAVVNMFNDYKALPYKNQFSCTSDQIKEFIEMKTGQKTDRQIMEYLLEQQDSRPWNTRKRLSTEWCHKITEAAFSPNAETQLPEKIDSFISGHSQLQSYANDTQHQGFLHSAIYQIALQREARFMGQRFIRDCGRLFYTEITRRDLEKAWNTLFIPPANDSLPIYRLVSDQSRTYLLYPPPKICDGPWNFIRNITPNQCCPELSIGVIERMMNEYTGDPNSYKQLHVYLQEKAKRLWNGLSVDGHFGVTINCMPDYILCALRSYIHSEFRCDQDVKCLVDEMAAYNHFCKYLRTFGGKDFNIILRVFSMLWNNTYAQNALRIICRWFFQYGATAIICSPGYGNNLSSCKYVTDQIAADIPIPVYLETDDPDIELSNSHIAGCCLSSL